MEENTTGSTAQIVGGVSLGLSLLAVIVSVGGAIFGLCCAIFPLITSVLSAVAGLVSIGSIGFGYVTSNKEDELSEEQIGKAKMGMYLSGGALLLAGIAIAISCGPTIFFTIASVVMSIIGNF